MTGKGAIHIIEDFMDTIIPPIKVYEQPGFDANYTHQVTALFSMKELAQRAQRDIMPEVMARIAPAIERSIMEALMDGTKLEAFILECFKDEIRKQIQEAVQARLEDFIEEAIGS